jgi:general secretion pathway protein D
VTLRSPEFRAAVLRALLLAGCAVSGAGVQAGKPVKAPTPSALSVVNFVDTDIDAVARAISVILNRPILLDPRVRGKMTLYSQEGLTQAQTYDYFVSTLRGLGFAVVDRGGLLKIVPESDAKLQAGPVLLGSPAQAREQIVTRLFPVNHENASNLLQVLRPLISPNNTINVNAGSNTLVITDYADNQERLAAIIAALDTPSATDVEVIPLKHVQASDVVAVVQKLLDAAPQQSTGGNATPTPGAGQAGTASSGAPLILADSRNNTLLVRAPNQARLATMRALVARLDQPGVGGVAGSNIHVIYLKNAEAMRLATVLRAAFSAQDQRTTGNTAAGDSATRSSGGGSSGSAPVLTGSAGSGSSSSGNQQSTQATSPVTAIVQPSTGGFIQADPASNSLIVTASEQRFRELSAVVELLDSPRAQISVESLIVEVDASKALELGVQWGQILSYSSSTTLTLGTVISALETMSGTNILSTANLVTLDNEEAKIVVGQNVPFVTGSYTSTSTSSSSPFQTIERKDVGITLRLRPQIGPNGNIRMTIYQESSSVSSSTTPGTTNAGPTTNKRSIESTVTVKDGKILVLGGLIEDSDTKEANDLHGLGSLPLVGGLFRSLSTSRKKTNLLVFLRPVVMKDDDAAEQLSLDRYAFIRGRQSELPKDTRQILQDALPPTLRLDARISEMLAPAKP